MFDLQSSKLNVPCPSRAFTISTFRGWWHFRTQLSFFIISWRDHIFIFYFYSTLFWKVPNMHISIYSKHCGNFRCSCLRNSRARHLWRVQERAGGHRVPRGEQPRRGPVQVDLQQLGRAHQVSGHQHTAQRRSRDQGTFSENCENFVVSFTTADRCRVFW